MQIDCDEIASLLASQEEFLDATIYIGPPANPECSDENSGDERRESATINNLSGNQLRGEAELFLTKISDNGIEEENIGTVEKEVDDTSNTNTSEEAGIDENCLRVSKQQKLSHPILEVDITPKLERTWTRADILN
ncbi:uncharacterized protein [Anabrus simplex]|uniref:uncharacterized protein n=1 Tax=Anabrus simplex TaxID=316456 RepID=UPI0034DDBAEC